jgi:integration host factor subunit alpha
MKGPRRPLCAAPLPPRTSTTQDLRMALTKAALAETLFAQLGLNKREANHMVERFFEGIAAALEVGDTVKLSNFGHFTLREKLSLPGRNPNTREEIPISARRVVAFHPSAKLRSLVAIPDRTDSTRESKAGR